MKSQFRLADIFTDHMVFQANQPIRLFGTCQKGIKIDIRFHRFETSFLTFEETFAFEIPAQSVNATPFEVCLSSEKDSTTLKDCLCGHVIVASGQSNIEFIVKESTFKDYEASPLIRFYSAPKLPYEDAPIDFPHLYQKDPKWIPCEMESIPWFSCIGYLVSIQLAKELHEPIGIISCNLGDTSILSWANPGILRSYPSAQPYFERYDEELKQFSSLKEYQKRFKQQLPKLLEFYSLINKYVDQGIDASKAHNLAFESIPDPSIPMGPMHYNRPGGCYDTMLKHIFPYNVEAVIYYQGEQDHDKTDMYPDGIKSILETFRIGHRFPDLPIVIVQLPGYSYPGAKKDSIPLLRDIQKKSVDLNPFVYLASGVDLGEKDNVHPKNKTVLSRRIANILLEILYKKHKDSFSPQVIRATRSDNDILLKVARNPFLLHSISGMWSGFSCSRDGLLYELVTEVHYEKQIIILKNCKDARWVRYAYDFYPECDLYSGNDLPLLPFQIEVEE